MSDKKSTDTKQDLSNKVKEIKDAGIKIFNIPLSTAAKGDNEELTGEKEASVNVNPASDNPVGSAEEAMAEVGRINYY